MDLLFAAFEVITPWHWLGLALILLGLEMMFGTYDLLWLSGAAFLTAAFSVFLPENSWQIDLIVFSIAGVVLVVMGRTVFSGLREAKTDRPNLNQRGKSLIGKRAVVVDDFVAGEGRVRIGDTTWMAVAPADLAVSAGMEVTVQDVDSTVLKITV